MFTVRTSSYLSLLTSHNMKATLRHYLELHLVVGILAFTAILGLLLRGITPLALVFWRTLLAAIGLTVLIKMENGAWRMEHEMQQRAFRFPFSIFHFPFKKILPLLAVGALLAVHWMLFFGAARLANASVCLAGISTGSLWTAFLEPLFFRRRVRPLEVALGLVVLVGLYVIFVFEFDRFLGLVVAVLAAGLAALFSVLNAKLTPHYPPRMLTLWEIIGAWLTACVALPVYHFVIAPDEPVHFWPQGFDWLWLGLLAGVCTVYAYSAMAGLLRVFSAFTINLTINLEPIYGIAVAFLLFGESERMTTGFYLGAAIVLAAVLAYPALSRRGKKLPAV
jgi:drug/metabolite transporter (DMT)-like permease